MSSLLSGNQVAVFTKVSSEYAKKLSSKKKWEEEFPRLERMHMQLTGGSVTKGHLINFVIKKVQMDISAIKDILQETFVDEPEVLKDALKRLEGSESRHRVMATQMLSLLAA